MADKFVVGHEHCGVCGACLLNSGQLHKCPATVNMEVLALFLLESRRIVAKPTFRAMNGGGDKETGFDKRITKGDSI